MATALAFAYSARDAAGKVVKGRLEAPSQSAVLAKLQTLGMTPISIEEAKAGTGLQMELSFGGGKRVTLKDLAIMSRQMSTMIGAGLSLIRTLAILADQTENKTLGNVLATVRGDVEQGSSLSDSFAHHPRIFPPIMLHLLRAGEIGGFLDKSLVGVAETFEADVKLRGEIKSALTYPVVVLIIAVLASFGMIIFIVPVFEKMFAGLGGALPLPTQFLVVMSHNMIWIVPVLVITIVAIIAWWRANGHKESVRARVDPLKLRLPVFGDLMKKVAIARFSRNFSTMLASGVPILQALSIVGETSGNFVIEKALRKVQESVRQGKTVSGPLSEEAVFPSMVVQMIAVGEDAGSMEVMLDKVGDFYEAEVEATTKALTSLIEPLMIALIGIVVGGMVIALYLPTFSIYDQIK